MKLTYKELIIEVLQKTNEPLGVGEIWQKACEKGLDKSLQSIGKTPTQTIWNRLITDRQEKDTNSIFMQISQKPAKFWLRSRQNELLAVLKKEEKEYQKELKEEKTKFHERDLHPLLVKFLYESADFNLECKTIYHEKSKKSTSGKDKWNYPDIVGVYFPYNAYKDETLILLSNVKKNNYKFFSFELKISLDFSNLKESYFQAVSNSSWANEGYLVVLNELDNELLAELRRLNQSFGIGLIKLEADDLFSSRILLSAKERELDFQTLDMLVEKNADFKEFINDVNQQIKLGQGGKIRASFDEILEEEKMQKYLKEKHILED